MQNVQTTSLLHCPVAYLLWMRLIGETRLTWVIQTSCNVVFQKVKFHYREKEGFSDIEGGKVGNFLGALRQT